ncbi:MAG TPA: hypothetical protein PLO67_00040 [Saprospiraceae bacterium]|nr:hypothetical protein [Saprospiraceae bacterium]HPI08199.1 hypothetical protein [Saprospiraceae bacterium]
MRHLILLFTLLLLLTQRIYAQPQQVKTGVYLMNLYDLNMDEHSFYADFYIWFRWKGRIDPTNIEFVNAIEKWSMDKATFDGDSTPVQLKSGEKYKIFRIEGRFFHSFSLNRFPLDRHSLDIQIENPEHPADSLIYVSDTSGAQIRNTLTLVGWETEGSEIISQVHDYGTNFGNPYENAQRYSNLSYNITLSRPISYFLLKMLLPLFIVMLVSIGGLLLHPSHIDSRSSLPIGGLLTAVFLQQSYSGALPDTGYMVLMDKIYLLGYILISVVLLQIIRAGNVMAKDKPLKPVIKLEKRLAQVLFAVFVIGVMVLCAIP